MYCTPCARLMKSITPNTSVSPAAIRNSSTPSCSPFSVWTRRRVTDIAPLHPSPPRGEGQARDSLHRAILHVRIGVVGEHLLGDLRLILAVRALGHLHQVEVLDRIVIGVEFEIPAQ